MADDKIIDFGNAESELNRIIGQLKQADNVILKISQDALTMGRNLSNINLPSDLSTLTAENSRLTASIQTQSAALAQLQFQYTTLVRQRQNSSQRTAEESVNQSILNRNAMESARINSTLAGAYARLSAEQSKASRHLQDLTVRGRLATQTQRQYSQELRAAQRDFDRLNSRVLSADRAVGRFNRNVGNYPSQAVKGLKDLLGAFGLVGGLALAANVAKDIFSTTKEIQSLDMALKQVTGTQEAFAQSQMFLSRVADAYGADLQSLTKQFTQFYVSAKDKLSGNEIEGIFESITKAGATMGLSTQQQERAFLALNQMMSKGTIQAEELRGQLGEALPGAMGIMAKAMGVTEKQLGVMMKNGELLAADVLPKFAKQLEITYGIDNVKRIDNLTAAQGRYSNAWTNFVRGLDEDGNKLSNFMKKAIGVGADLLVGVSRLLESDGQERNRILKGLEEKGYNQTLGYYNSLKELKDEDLNNDKAYTLKKVAEETAEFNRLKNRNIILKALIRDTPLGKIETAENKAERIANEKSLNAINNLLSKRKGDVAAINKLLDKGVKTETEAKELSKKELKDIEDALKAKHDALKKEIELNIAKNKVILDDDELYYSSRFNALNKDLELRKQLADLDYKEELRLAKDNNDKKKVALLNYQIESLKLIQDFIKKRGELEKLDLDPITKLLNTDFRKDLMKPVADSAKKAAKELEKLGEKIEKTEAAMLKLKAKNIEFSRSFFEEFADKSTIPNVFKLFDGKDSVFSRIGKGMAFTKDSWKSDTVQVMEATQEMFNFISQFGQANFEEEKKRLQSQYDIALKYAGDNKEAQEKLANDLEARKAEIANREAKAKKKQALINIAIDTAQAIIGVWANPGFPAAIPLAILIGGLGLAQAAMVASQEIPQYWMGGTHDGGLMMVNDGAGNNYRETIVTPDGNIHKPQGKNVIMNAPKGTEIFTHDQWNDEMNNMLSLDRLLKSNDINYHVQNNGITKQEMKEAFMETIGSQPQHHTSFNEEGITSYFVKKGNMTKINSKRGNSQKTRF